MVQFSKIDDTFFRLKYIQITQFYSHFGELPEKYKEKTWFFFNENNAHFLQIKEKRRQKNANKLCESFQFLRHF